MARLTFINLPVKDLQKSKEFFTSLGFSFNPQFTNDKAACLIINDGASYAMLVSYEYYLTFIPGREIPTASTSELIIALSAENRIEVDVMMDKALAAGGTDYRTEDQGFMYGRAFTDPDGHIWEIFYMDMSAVPQTS